MAFTSNSGGGPMADINVTPLVDVMLVLLIIFMVTAPALSYQIQVDLPQRTTNPPPQPKDPPEPIRLRIEAGGTVTWNNSPIPLSVLQSSLEVEAERSIQPTLEIETDPDAQYETLAKVLSRAKNSGMEKIAFVDPGQ
ncbi:ExbD/TolR family protein [Arenimonas terrae]|jgi:biopolymer transport protein ExbD|uniref:Biopolymer transporter ExbD n=1 Tax=Arenimonas terrae TaxID=2546226 RepID=A0A5C4RQT6_9GAMM|nr:biopolymer transporter ExbD [Arenimonas terrae]TNJ33334.1 biopolymer transporter ExbD [Arenimonas terrae]